MIPRPNIRRDTRNHVLQDPYVYVVVFGPVESSPCHNEKSYCRNADPRRMQSDSALWIPALLLRRAGGRNTGVICSSQL